MSKYLWYAGYGSNLNRQRFICYIQGGTPVFGKKANKGCTNRIAPLEDRIIKIPHHLYFAWPSSLPPSENWGAGGVAFLDPKKSETDYSIARVWKITAEQYEAVREQEGRDFYDHEIQLGDRDGIPVRTMTHSSLMTDVLKPSTTYLKTIMLGLLECSLDIHSCAGYLKTKEGIAGQLSDAELLAYISNLNK